MIFFFLLFFVCLDQSYFLTHVWVPIWQLDGWVAPTFFRLIFYFIFLTLLKPPAKTFGLQQWAPSTLSRAFANICPLVRVLWDQPKAHVSVVKVDILTFNFVLWLVRNTAFGYLHFLENKNCGYKKKLVGFECPSSCQVFFFSHIFNSAQRTVSFLTMYLISPLARWLIIHNGYAATSLALWKIMTNPSRGI